MKANIWGGCGTLQNGISHKYPPGHGRGGVGGWVGGWVGGGGRSRGQRCERQREESEGGVGERF